MSIKSKIRTYTILLKEYALKHKFLSIVGLYFLISITIKILFSVDVLIPCLWKSLFHIECPGCGLTRASIELIQLNFVKAYKFNPLIFLILPFGLLYVFIDIRKMKLSNN